MRHLVIFLVTVTMVMATATTAMAQPTVTDCDESCWSRVTFSPEEGETLRYSLVRGLRTKAPRSARTYTGAFRVRRCADWTIFSFSVQNGEKVVNQPYNLPRLDGCGRCPARRSSSRATKTSAPTISQAEVSDLSSQLDALQKAMRQGDETNSAAITNLSEEVQEGFEEVNNQIEELRAGTLDPETREELETQARRLRSLRTEWVRVPGSNSWQLQTLDREIVGFDDDDDPIFRYHLPQDRNVRFLFGARVTGGWAGQGFISPALELGIRATPRVYLLATAGYACFTCGEGTGHGFSTEPGMDVMILRARVTLGLRIQGLFALGENWQTLAGGLGPVLNVPFRNEFFSLRFAATLVLGQQSLVNPLGEKESGFMAGVGVSMSMLFMPGVSQTTSTRNER